jgi:hypothetical protein
MSSLGETGILIELDRTKFQFENVSEIDKEIFYWHNK